MSWESDLLAKIGAAATANKITALSLWAQSEGTPASWNNWLATTLDGYGGIDVNSDGVKAYPTETDGVDATAATLQGGAYSGVIAAFRGSGNYDAIWSAINASPWCAHCQNGQYPVALYDYINGPSSTSQPASSGYPTLQEGDTGSAVKVLQTDLVALHYTLAIDGDFGPDTETIVRKFQGAHDLTVDGIVGPATWSELLSLTAPPPGAESGTGGSSNPAPSEPAAGIDGSVQNAWSTLGTKTGADANGQLANLAGFADIVKGAIR
jgi:Putative peptidoglycan binding domain